MPTVEPVDVCPACAMAVAPGDVFCESCGAELDPASAVGPTSPSTTTTAASASAAAILVTAPADPQDAAACPDCGGDRFSDGFCATCGAKRPTWRDHFTEQPAPGVAGVCDRGIVHTRNEDAMACGVVGDRIVLVVCDGVTTAPDSDRASLVASRAARDHLALAPAGPSGTAAAVSHWSAQLTAACAVANHEALVVARLLGDPPEPPSCTFVASVVEHGLIHTAWCGDSRAYWLADDGPAVQLSFDHSLGTEMIAAGMTREDAEADPTCHTITRWLGADSIDPTPETGSLEVPGPGWLLVCSDGLWNYVSDAEAMGALIDSFATSDPLVIAGRLVDFANTAGGQDNITATLARLGDAAS